MIGEVWLCSGQSNMEMPLAGWPPRDTIQNSSIEIKNADYPQIRLFTVTRAYAAEPQFDCLGKWSECNPQTIEQFSATAFFFGKKLHKELNVPIGLIHSSWGGTPVESWISKENLIKFEKYRDTYKRIEASKEQIVLLNNWLNKHTIINVNEKPESERWKNLNFNDEECSSINYDDAAWYDINLPQLWESTEIGAFDGVIWFRKKIEIPEKWINKNLVLELGPIDDMDITFVNGNKVGAYEATWLLSD
jgi:sialate O-acetylesterase